ncbi:MAG TPA: lysophospholipid acyltransferase family protein [Sphingobacteriaceae bacterium]
MNKLLGYLFTPIHYIFWGILLLVFHPVQWLSLKLGGYHAHKRSVDILNFFLVGTYYVMGSHVSFRNRVNLPSDRSIIFIANHQSLYDIPPMIWFLRKHHAKFISKIELTRGIPSISFNLKYGGAANIDRKDPKQAIGEILKLAQRMKTNTWSTVIFPEGTRSRTGQLKPFAVGGIATLLKKVPGALVVPVAIDGAWKMVQYGKFPLSFGEKMSWTVLDPIEPEGLTPDEVVSAAEQAIRKHLGQFQDSL